MNTYPINQYAPDYLQGLMQPPPAEVGYEDQGFDYVYTPPTGELVGSGISRAELQLDQDADFYLCGWYLAKVSIPFLVSLTDASGWELTDGFVDATTISFNAGFPSALSPMHPFPAGSKIGLTFNNYFGDDNPVPMQIVFKGFKRFRRSNQ